MSEPSRMKSNLGRRQRLPRRAAAAAARRGTAAVASDTDSSATFQSPRKRIARTSTTERKKPRTIRTYESSTVRAPVTADAEQEDPGLHRYPLRSRSATRTSQPNTTGMSSYNRSGSEESIASLPLQAVTPASVAPRPRHLTFGDDGAVPPCLFSAGSATCRCPKHNTFRDQLGFDYLNKYGEDFLQHIKERESREHKNARRLTNSSSTQSQGSLHDSSTISSPAPSKGSSIKDDDDSDAQSPASTAPPSTELDPRTPRPETVIDTKARIRHGDTAMRFLEEPSELLERQPFVTQRMRSVLVSWLVEVAIEYNVSTAAYHLAISILDHVLDLGPTEAELNAWPPWLNLDGSATFESDDEEEEWPYGWFVIQRCEFQALGW